MGGVIQVYIPPILDYFAWLIGSFTNPYAFYYNFVRSVQCNPALFSSRNWFMAGLGIISVDKIIMFASISVRVQDIPLGRCTARLVHLWKSYLFSPVKFLLFFCLKSCNIDLNRLRPRTKAYSLISSSLWHLTRNGNYVVGDCGITANHYIIFI